MKVSDEHVTVLELVGYLGAVLYYIAMRFDFGSYGTMAIIISMILILFVYVFGYPKYRAEQVMAAFFGMVYVAVMLSFIYLTRNLPDGKFLVWLIFYAPGVVIPVPTVWECSLANIRWLRF